MIVAGFPVSVRQFHHLACGWLRLALLARETRAARARLSFLYFSYAPDFEFLALSLTTLRAAVGPALLGHVFLAEDQKAPFERTQLATLRDIVPDLHVIEVRDFEWGSPRSTHAELQMFKSVCAQLEDPFDLLVKIDSDVLLLPSDKWSRLLRSTAGAIGDGHYLQHRFAQGGLYMIRRHLIDRVLSPTTLEQVEEVARRIESVGEDMAISQLLADAGSPFFFTRMMLFPDEYGPLKRLGGATRAEFMALHCHKDKLNMPALAKRFGLLLSPTARRH